MVSLNAAMREQSLALQALLSSTDHFYSIVMTSVLVILISRAELNCCDRTVFSLRVRLAEYLLCLLPLF